MPSASSITSSATPHVRSDAGPALDPSRPPAQNTWRLVVPGFCASLVGIGLARFAYTPLLPAIITAGWFTAGSAAYLGAANLAGYLGGVLAGGVAAHRIDARWLLRGAMALAATSLLACAWPAGFAWFFSWRFLSGVSGGVAMVLAAPTILPHVPSSRHGLVSGAIFMGIGVGIAISGTLVPLVLKHGLAQAWLGLGFIACLFTAVGWRGWQPATASTSWPPRSHPRHLPTTALRTVYVGYALNAFALVPSMVFLVSYVARGLGQGFDTSTNYWILYGLGSIAGPLITGRIADLIGFRSTLRLVFLSELLAFGALALNASSVTLILSSLVAGACTIGVVPVVLGRTRTILRDHPSVQPAAWRTATASFAVLQAGGAYFFSFLLDRSQGDYRLLFALGAGAMAIALMLDLAISDATPQVRGGQSAP